MKKNIDLNNDYDNLLLLGNTESVDAANREFYARFPYPWPPMTFPKLADPDFETIMLNQSLGDFTHHRIPIGAKIWVAGCGTNQALYTALRFPKSVVVGTDISSSSLEMCRNNASQLRLDNLTLREESLNQASYDKEFDYIICTGVIHHNADPSVTLANLTRALRNNGVIELMVYNRFHRTFTSAFQKAVRTVSRYNGRATSYDEELELARMFVSTEPVACSPQIALLSESPESESHFADSLIQPIEHSYTIESLNAMANTCGLNLLLPCYNQFDAQKVRSWAMKFSTESLQARIDGLPDIVRWQITNLLLQETSPMLWFFLEHQQDSCQDQFERYINQEFLSQKFVRASTTLQNYFRGLSDLNYKLSSTPMRYPFEVSDGLPKEVVAHSGGDRTMREVLSELGIDAKDHKTITDIRNETVTSQRPFLRAVQPNL